MVKTKWFLFYQVRDSWINHNWIIIDRTPCRVFLYPHTFLKSNKNRKTPKYFQLSYYLFTKWSKIYWRPPVNHYIKDHYKGALIVIYWTVGLWSKPNDFHSTELEILESITTELLSIGHTVEFYYILSKFLKSNKNERLLNILKSRTTCFQNEVKFIDGLS